VRPLGLCAACSTRSITWNALERLADITVAEAGQHIRVMMLELKPDRTTCSGLVHSMADVGDPDPLLFTSSASGEMDL